VLLAEKVTLVTGAGRGLGQAVARAYARHGAHVIAVARTESELGRTATLIQAEGGRVLTMPVDIGQDEAVRAMAGQILDRFGRLDVLVNNAARLPLKSFEDTTPEEWDRTLAVNLRAAFLICKLFYESMKARGGGSIVNVSSNAGVIGFPLETAYCASKFGLEGFSRALALEARTHNIAVNTITPGSESARIRIKPTSVTQAEYDAFGGDERAQWLDPMLLTEAFVFLARQDGGGVTGERFFAYDLSNRIRRDGWFAVTPT
jgi:NAD(P)-dependent dehydrogenase (short-subunit alcohol dehydrogenase family)